MTTIDPSLDQHRADDVCAADRSCAGSGCGCATPTASDPVAAPSRRGLKAGLLAAACALACLAAPLAVGGVAAASGAVAGEEWLLAGLATAAAVVGLAVVRQRRAGKLC